MTRRGAGPTGSSRGNGEQPAGRCRAAEADRACRVGHRPGGHCASHPRAVHRQAALHLERSGVGQQRPAVRRPEPRCHPGPVERGGRAAPGRAPDPRHARVRQAGQHLGPERRHRDPDHQHRQGLHAVLVARRPVDLLHRDGLHSRPLPVRRGCPFLHPDLSDPDARPSRRHRSPEAAQRPLQGRVIPVVLLAPTTRGLAGRPHDRPLQ